MANKEDLFDEEVKENKVALEDENAEDDEYDDFVDDDEEELDISDAERARISKEYASEDYDFDSEETARLYESTMAARLFNPDNNEPICIFDAKGKEIWFDQVALVPLKDDDDEKGENEVTFCLLKPQEVLKGDNENSVYVFAIVSTNEGRFAFLPVENPEITERVFAEYRKVAAQAGANVETPAPAAKPKPPTPPAKRPTVQTNRPPVQLMKPPTPPTPPKRPKPQ